MKYLVHLCPPTDFSERVLAYRDRIKDYIASVSKNALHCTLMTFPGAEDREADIVSALEDNIQTPFQVSIQSLDLFDESSLVLKLQKSPEISQLHQNVIAALRGFVDRSQTFLPPGDENDPERVKLFATYGSPFYAQFYNPHLSIAQVRAIPPDLDLGFFQNLDWKVTEMYLSKKEKEWKTVKVFQF
ncbi:2'-5' RNA ligase family protein [Candidatus Woesearchaeota archaeon]|nr:2'-5' RNA ligase family protein [Candidatus Woesearchaeota archaeon]